MIRPFERISRGALFGRGLNLNRLSWGAQRVSRWALQCLSLMWVVLRCAQQIAKYQVGADVTGHQGHMGGALQGAACRHGAAVVNDDVCVAGRRLLQVHGRIMDPGYAGIDEQGADGVLNPHQVQGLCDHFHFRPLAQLCECACDFVAGVQDANHGRCGWTLWAGKPLGLAKLVE